MSPGQELYKTTKFYCCYPLKEFPAASAKVNAICLVPNSFGFTWSSGLDKKADTYIGIPLWQQDLSQSPQWAILIIINHLHSSD
jgi:hypothetical protein